MFFEGEEEERRVEEGKENEEDEGWKWMKRDGNGIGGRTMRDRR